MIRNLSYFVYPRKDSQWLWNVEQVRPHLPSFNGKLVVAIAHDAHTEPASRVAAAFGDPRVLYMDFRNDPELRESVAFLPAMRLLRSASPDEATFYAHAKGIRHEGEVLTRVRAWIRAMVLLNLGDIGLIERLLRSHAAVGCIRRVMAHVGSSWHYSGTFFWFRHADVFLRNWESLSPGFYGVESYLGRLLPLQASYDLTEGRDFGDLYRTTIPGDEIRRIFEAQRAGVEGIAR